MADAFTKYQQELARRKGTTGGIGGVFQEEGPGMTPDPRTLNKMKRIKLSSELNPQLFSEKGLQAKLLKTLRDDELSKIMPPSGIEQALKKVKFAGSKTGLYDEEKAPVTLLEKKNLEKSRQGARDLDTARIEAMPDDSPAFAESPLDAIANMIKKAQIIQKPSGPKADQLSVDKEKYDARAEDFRAKEKALVENFGSGDQSVTLAESSKAKTQEDSMSNLFSGGMADFLKALDRDVPTVGDKGELLETYKKEFADATGLDVSGKVDKSSALMAMGLAMMQNRAGKGFNVGNILSAVGEAGEKALPALEKAKDVATQARISAGKYALNKIKSDEDARDAIAASNASIRQELMLKNYDAQNEAKLEVLKANLEGTSTDQMPKGEYNEEIKIGTNTYKIRMGVNPSNLQPVFINPSMSADKISDAYTKTISGLESIGQMERLTNLLIDESANTPGGISGRRFLDLAKGVMKSMGINQEQLFSSNEFKQVSADDELDAIRTAFIMRFKRFISQETGNGISNVDVTMIDQASGGLDSLMKFKNPEKSLIAFGELRKLFDGSLASLQPMINSLTDRDFYYQGESGDKMYDKTMINLSDSLSGSMKFFSSTPNIVEGDDGENIVTYDVRDR